MCGSWFREVVAVVRFVQIFALLIVGIVASNTVVDFDFGFRLNFKIGGGGISENRLNRCDVVSYIMMYRRRAFLVYFSADTLSGR